jgi:hypothetical protein
LPFRSRTGESGIKGCLAAFFSIAISVAETRLPRQPEGHSEPHSKRPAAAIERFGFGFPALFFQHQPECFPGRYRITDDQRVPGIRPAQILCDLGSARRSGEHVHHARRHNAIAGIGRHGGTRREYNDIIELRFPEPCHWNLALPLGHRIPAHPIGAILFRFRGEGIMQSALEHIANVDGFHERGRIVEFKRPPEMDASHRPARSHKPCAPPGWRFPRAVTSQYAQRIFGIRPTIRLTFHAKGAPSRIALMLNYPRRGLIASTRSAAPPRSTIPPADSTGGVIGA